MGVELAVAAIPMIMGTVQGISSWGAKSAQGEMQIADGILLESESMREASRIEDEGRRFADDQKMMYIGSGVEIGGSAVVTLAQTDKWTAAEADAERSRGRAIREYYGRMGELSKRQGMSDFISGVAGGIGQGVSTYAKAHAGFGSGGGLQQDHSPTGYGTNPPTAAQLRRPGATTRVKKFAGYGLKV